MPESLCNKFTGNFNKSETPAQVFSTDLYKILKNTFFTKHA